MPEAARVHAYPLGHEDRELERLTLQAHLFEPLTQRLFEKAGLKPGMRVLDVGSGSGDVALLAREIVGPTGVVIGVDRAPEAITMATTRAQAHDYHNVLFFECDLAAHSVDRLFEDPRFERAQRDLPGDVAGDVAGDAFDAFDAVIGRLVLMHQPDPAGILRRVLHRVRPDGLVIFQELETYVSRAVPPAPTFDGTLTLINRTLEAAGSHNEMGLELRSTFNAAGLPTPEFMYEAVVAAEPGHPVYRVVAGIARTLAPLMQRFGTASPEDLDFDTLAARMEAEVGALNGVVVSPALVGAWTRTRIRTDA
jgi:SAM-dependent methyltransferase